MKKFIIALALAMRTFGAFAQDYEFAHEEKAMVLPDGAVAPVMFFKKWEDAGKYLKIFDLKGFYALALAKKVKTESEMGYFRKTYKETENDSVAALCAVHKEFGAKYSIAWLNFGDRVTRCMFTYKNGKLTYDRTDFFKESHEVYQEYRAYLKEEFNMD